MLSDKVLYIRDLGNCPPAYLNDPARKDFFEIVWLRNEDALHVPQHSFQTLKGDWIYLIPPYRVHQLNKAGKNGVLISFKQELLEGDLKEFLLDVFRMFNIQGEFSCLQVNEESSKGLISVLELLEAEYNQETINLIMVKAVLKVFLLQLIQLKEQHFTLHDINEKRVYEFMLLLEKNYEDQRNAEFYAGKLGISAKRLNQILKEKLNKTGVQIIHDRLILEAKRQIIHSENTIKEIAYKLGFKDHSYFSRFFKLHAGLTPLEFQNKVKEHVISHENTLYS
ncbi:AraC family transcriptional regulator [Zobellia galactanivorans]|uniref:AraC-type transcriptional regulator n=1 Tax=Zobellia galactanivorans (strain DSM 12802 / CCUG 47099 / CIP 106680 / NCIMB 13871 / Dsij) TaxID=63186 RepID=G0L878_ZOBGA|nr:MULTISPECIES: AraC family transcriptional regulator [Zobellia]MBU3026346.1 AraC family transcriptional regulator [Zobellia galactanivorans]MDO6807661.1 AraC family transcriptional regulator [Zobellia galactanivorans]OWW25474.1 AraC family transcriptional regulator [Zobellia sp. OII3]CAZ98078.1 AraC-type transcriptional regulator [Zobellia galactanivorans]